jgi:hypothetical protein
MSCVYTALYPQQHTNCSLVIPRNNTGRGYSAGLGPGAGALGGTGASHSGIGSFSYTNTTAAPGACYGNVTTLLAGSGGGNSTSTSSSSSIGGAGGGVLVLKAALLQVAAGARLTVDGRPGGTAGAGGGSGGSASIETGSLTGTGSLSDCA